MFQNLLVLVMKNTGNVLNMFVCFDYKIQTAYGLEKILFLTIKSHLEFYYRK